MKFKLLLNLFDHADFNHGRSSINNEFHESRPKSFVVPENVGVVREVILQERREIEISLDISGISIHSILHEHLAVKKICSCWI